jgi:U6 snRNA-associated Sm-like protein LSm1
MENLSLEGPPPPGGPVEGGQVALGPGHSPGPNQQLPPQMFTTAAQLLDMTDSKTSMTST